MDDLYTVVESGNKLDVQAWYHSTTIGRATGLLLHHNPENLILPSSLPRSDEIKNISMHWSIIEESFLEGISEKCRILESVEFFDCEMKFSVLMKLFTKSFLENIKRLTLVRVRITDCREHQSLVDHVFHIPYCVEHRARLLSHLIVFQIIDTFEINFKGVGWTLFEFEINDMHAKSDVLNPIENYQVIPLNKRARSE